MSEIVQTKIQKWGNGLALRVAGLIRDIPQFEQNTPVDVEVFKDGFTVRKAKPNQQKFVFPVKEKDLLKDITPESAHADALASVSSKELES